VTGEVTMKTGAICVTSHDMNPMLKLVE